jgi:hypothetical protein
MLDTETTSPEPGRLDFRLSDTENGEEKSTDKKDCFVSHFDT